MNSQIVQSQPQQFQPQHQPQQSIEMRPMQAAPNANFQSQPPQYQPQPQQFQPQPQQFQPQSQPQQFQPQPQKFQHQSQPSMGATPMQASPNGFQAFLQTHQVKVEDTSVFSAPSKGITAIKLNQASWIKSGAAVSYIGNVKFKASSIFSTGICRAITMARTGEGMKLMKATGVSSGCVVYVADEGKYMVNLELNAGESVVVKGEDVVAFEESVNWNVEKLKGGMHSLMKGAKYFVRFTGPGNLCIGCNGDPIIMPVTPSTPIRVDPDNAVLWTKNTVPSSKSSVNFIAKALGCYRPTGEEKQWAFSGEGFVVIQPVEESANREKTKGLLAKIFKS